MLLVLDLGLPSLKNCEKEIPVVHMPLRYGFCCGPNRLRQKSILADEKSDCNTESPLMTLSILHLERNRGERNSRETQREEKRVFKRVV